MPITIGGQRRTGFITVGGVVGDGGGGAPSGPAGGDLGGTYPDPTVESVLDSKVVIQQIGSPTYTSQRDRTNTAMSAGWISGGDISNAGAGTFDVAAGTGYIRDVNGATEDIFSFDWVESLAIAIADGQVLGVFVDFNGGSPVIATADITVPSPFVNGRTTFLLGLIMREGTDFTFKSFRTNAVDIGFLSNLFAASAFTKPRANNAGLILSETGTRNLAISAGAVWAGLNLIPIAALDTAVADVFDTYFTSDSGATFTRGTSVTQWDNLQFNDITSGLVTLANNKFGVHWLYMNLDGTMSLLFGQAQHDNEADAEAEPVPSIRPDKLISQLSWLVGRVIFKKSEAAATEVESVYGEVFTGATSRPPSGAAGGDLGGTYPDPDVVNLSIASEAQGDILYRNATVWVRLAAGVSGQFLKTLGAAANPLWDTPAGGAAELPRGYIDGMITSNGTDADHDIDFAAGVARNAANDADIEPAALTKRIDATWVAGNDQGGRASSVSLSADTWYHMFAITVGGVDDWGFDTSITAANLIADHSATDIRRIGAVLTDSSANIEPYFQYDDEFWFETPMNDFSAVPPSIDVLITISAPLGLTTWALGQMRIADDVVGKTYVAAHADMPVPVSLFSYTKVIRLYTTATTTFDDAKIRTNTSSQIRHRATDATITAASWFTKGWIDPRGRTVL